MTSLPSPASQGKPSETRLKRETFSTSRLLEFCSRKELINQTGHGVDHWPLVILKENPSARWDEAISKLAAPDDAL